MPQPKPAPHFRTQTVLAIQCDLCPSRTHTGAIASNPPDNIAAVFAGRGWRRYRNDTHGDLQVCPRCARHLSDRWLYVPLAKDAHP